MNLRMHLAIPWLISLLAMPAIAEENSSTFIGYFRTTLGLTDKGGMQGFQAPGARAKYRLGNEPDTVFEAGIDHRFAPGPNAPKGSYLQGVFMVSGYAGIDNSNSLKAADLPQAFVKISRYFGDFDLWAGRRYYQRKQIDINDYFWLNTAQGAHVGAGLEDLGLGSGKLDFAIMNYEDSAVVSLKDPAVNKTLHSRLAELRYRDIVLSDELKLSSWLSYTNRPEDPELGYKAEAGRGAALWLDFKLGGSSNSLAAIYRQGLGIVQGTTDARPIRENSGSGYKLDEAVLMELSNSYQLDTSAYSLLFLALTHKEATGVTPAGSNSDEVTWNSVGARPVFYLSEFQSLAVELGYDQVKNGLTGKDGSVSKETVAWQFTKEKSAGARPMIRLFATHAQWSSDFKGLVGGSTYKDKTAGWSGGVQTEVWW